MLTGRLPSRASQERHCSSQLLDELKENVSPLRHNHAKNVEKQNALKKVEDLELVGGHLLIVDDVGTPLRRTTFIRDSDNCSPKYVTRTPERRIVSVDGFQSNLSSPQAVPDCYATPLRRTTFVTNSPQVKTGYDGVGRVESNFLFGKVPRSSERTPHGTVEEEIKSRVHLNSVPGEPSKGTSEIFRQHQKPDDILRDVSKSPLILEDRLLHLQDVNQSDKLYPERPRHSVASSKCSPSESEYHTAVTTPYDQSFSEDEDIDEFVDSHICSETVTGDISLCQQHLALKCSSDVTFMGNGDCMVIENVVVEDLSKLPMNTDCVSHLQAETVTSITEEYEVCTEVVSEVLKSEIYVTEMSTSSHIDEVKASFMSANMDTLMSEHTMTDFEHNENEHEFFHSARSVVQADDVHYNADILSSHGVGNCSSTGYDAYKRLSSTPVLKVNGTESASNQSDVSGDRERYNRTYSKSAHNNVMTRLSGPRSASRPLFTGSMVGIRSTGDESDCVLPLDMAESGFLETALEQPETYVVHHAHNLPKPQLSQYHTSRQSSGAWSGGEMSVMDRGVFSQVGGQTRHMISPGQKRQSLIARLRNDGPYHSTQSSDAVVGLGHGKRQHLEPDSSPVRKRPLIAASKPSECCFSVLY